MDVWTAIKLRSAGLKNAYLGAFGEAKHVDYAGHAGLGRMNRIHLIMKLRCRASKVVNFITSTKRGKVTLCRRSSSRSFALIRSLFAEKNFKDYPKLRTRAKRCCADIFFLDEAGVRSDSALQRTWGAKGETPVVQTSGQRQGDLGGQSARRVLVQRLLRSNDCGAFRHVPVRLHAPPPTAGIPRGGLPSDPPSQDRFSLHPIAQGQAGASFSSRLRARSEPRWRRFAR
jgi:hypothetical protein